MTSVPAAAAEKRAPIEQGMQTAGDFVPDEAYFSAARPAFGEARLSLEFGSIAFDLEGLSDPQSERLRRLYRPFLVARKGKAPDVTLRLADAGVPRFLALPGGRAEVYRMGRRSRGSRLLYWAYEFAGRLDLEQRRAELALTTASGPEFERGLENFLRALTADYVLLHGGLLLHGSCVVRGGRAYVFFGPSGSGKTTVTHLSPHDMVLSDDLTLLERGRDESGTMRFYAAGIPFGMAHHRVPDTRGRFPVASLNRLVQSMDVRREALRGAPALAEVAGSLPFAMAEERTAGRALEIAGELLREVPAYRLHFRRDDAFWGVVQEA